MLALLGVTVTSCGSGHPAFHHAVFPGLERYDEQHMRGAFETPLVLPPTLRAAVLWVDQTADGSEPALPESARTRVLDRFQHALLAPPLVGISPLPTMLAANGTASIDLDAVRSAAAHMQSDVAILVLTTSEHTVDWNALALTYSALVTTMFVPGDDLHVDLSAQACAIDVRTGLFIACAASSAGARDRFVIPAWRRTAFRSLAVQATEDAFADLPERLHAAIGARLAAAPVARASLTAAVRALALRGVPYATAAATH